LNGFDVISPERDRARQQHESIVNQLNQRMSEKAAYVFLDHYFPDSN
jgi:hypothetical protein